VFGGWVGFVGFGGWVGFVGFGGWVCVLGWDLRVGGWVGWVGFGLLGNHTLLNLSVRHSQGARFARHLPINKYKRCIYSFLYGTINIAIR
jgi:hypothetical protein